MWRLCTTFNRKRSSLSEKKEEEISKLRETHPDLPNETKLVNDHPKDQVIGGLLKLTTLVYQNKWIFFQM